MLQNFRKGWTRVRLVSRAATRALGPNAKVKVQVALAILIMWCFIWFVFGTLHGNENSAQISTLKMQLEPSEHDISPAVMKNIIQQKWNAVKGIISSFDTQYHHLRYHETTHEINEAFNHFDANWPCLWGENVIGIKQQAGDGVKWGCGAEYLKVYDENCIVYSIGSRNDFTFEKGIHSMAPNCKIFTFDPTVAEPKIPDSLANKMKFYKWGISGNDNPNTNYYLLSTMMKKLGHSHIDILKIDAEGHEWNAFTELDKLHLFPSVGQLYIEVHVGDLYYQGYKAPNDHIEALKLLFEIFEKNGLRMFHKEINSQWGSTCCSEYSFIQSYWHPQVRNYSVSHSTVIPTQSYRELTDVEIVK